MNRSIVRLLKKSVMLMLIFSGVLLLIKFSPEIIEMTASVNKFRDMIQSTGKWGPVALILFQVLQVVIAPIPGEIVQIAGGYVYGTLLGTLYITIGMLLGSAIAFYFTRCLGGSFVERFIKKTKFQWIQDMMESRKFSVFLFVFFLIPGLPKDVLIYIAGLSPIKPFKFLVILVLGRFPSLFVSVIVGSNLYKENYLVTAIISVSVLLLFLLGFFCRDKIQQTLSKLNNVEA